MYESDDAVYTVKHEHTQHDSYTEDFWVVMRNGDETPMAYNDEATAKRIARHLNDAQPKEA